MNLPIERLSVVQIAFQPRDAVKCLKSRGRARRAGQIACPYAGRCLWFHSDELGMGLVARPAAGTPMALTSRLSAANAERSKRLLYLEDG